MMAITTRSSTNVNPGLREECLDTMILETERVGGKITHADVSHESEFGDNLMINVRFSPSTQCV